MVLAAGNSMLSGFLLGPMMKLAVVDEEVAEELLLNEALELVESESLSEMLSV